MTDKVYLIIAHEGDEWADYLSLVGVYTDKTKAKAMFNRLCDEANEETWYELHEANINKLQNVYLGGYGE